jgi:5-formyltetrahydrofolate cyclo-ligase
VSGSAADDKRRARDELRARCRQVPSDRAAQAARAAAGHALALPEFTAAARVGLYAALPDELPTAPLLDAAWQLGKRVLLPRTLPSGRLEFAAAQGFQDLQPARWGVQEPVPEIPGEPLDPDVIVFVPGLAFDRIGYRLGRGSGFYDRTFPPGVEDVPILVGLGYGFQLVDRLPREAWDRRVRIVVTEVGAHRVEGAGRAP